MRQSKDARKIERSFELPRTARDNTPEAIERALTPAVDAGLLAVFPFGTDLTKIEQRLLPALQILRSASLQELVLLMLRGITRCREDFEYLDRIGLAQPRKPSEWLYSILIRGALAPK